jgi:hypothetical protein
MSYESNDVDNLKNVLQDVINLMELVEDMDTKDDKISGFYKKDYVMKKMEQKIGMLFPSYKHEIETIIEATIYLSKLGRTIMVNNEIKKCFKNKSCFSW